MEEQCLGWGSSVLGQGKERAAAGAPLPLSSPFSSDPCHGRASFSSLPFPFSLSLVSTPLSLISPLLPPLSSCLHLPPSFLSPTTTHLPLTASWAIPEVCLDLTECWTPSEVAKPWPPIPPLPLLSTVFTGYWRNKGREGRKACRLDLKCWSLGHRRREFGQSGRELPRGERRGKMERLRARGFTTLSCQSLLSTFGFGLCHLGLFLQVVTSGECLHSSLTLTNFADLCTYP